MAISKAGTAIESMDEWFNLAGPKSDSQWVDGRSAKELARAWLSNRDPPSEVSELFASHPNFGPILEWNAEPEARLPFDGFRGEPRNTDLAIKAIDRFGDYFIAVEAKADEPFSETLSDALIAALERRIQNPNSNGMARIEQLAKSLFGPIRLGEPKLNLLRYQLLTACAGAVSHAERLQLPRTVVLVHEFVTDRTDDALHSRNAADLDAFMHRLSHEERPVRPGAIMGPFALPGAPLFQGRTKLYIGKAVRDIRSGRRCVAS